MKAIPSIALLTLVGTACRSEKSVTTVNAAPSALISSHQNGDDVLEGVSIQVFGQVTDSNHLAELLETAWYYDGVEICGWTPPDSSGGTTCDFTPEYGKNTIRLEVRDPEGSGALHTVDLNVIENEIPTATIQSPSSSDLLYADQKVLLEGTISDVEDSPEDLTVIWTSDIDGEITADTNITSAGNVSTADYLSMGQHIIQLLVTDTAGNTAADTINIQVNEANDAPTCGILSPSNNSVSVFGDEILFTGEVNDTDLSGLTITWTSDKDGDIGTSTPNSTGEVSLSTVTLSENEHVVTLRAIDPGNLECTDSVVVRVGTPPAISIVSPSNNTEFIEGDNITFEVLVSDNQDAPEDIDLNWSLDWQPYTTMSADSTGIAEFIESGISPGSHTLSIVATDSDGMTDTTQVAFSINGSPSTPVISILPNTPSTSDTLNLSITQPSIDPEGLSISYDYQWSKNGVPQPGETSSTLSSNLTSKNDLWTIEVTPTDGTTFGTPATANVTIQNTAPTIDSLSIASNGTVYNDSIITCTATVSDPDETVVPTYSWNIGGQTATGSSINLSNYSISSGDTISCTATANDGTDTVAQSVFETISNRAPIVSGVSISPTLLYSNSTANCAYQSQDADGDTLTNTVTWMVNGQSIGSGVAMTLTGLAFPGDALTCMASADDGSIVTTETSTAISITNSLPTTPSVTLSSSNSNGNPAAEQHDLYCSIFVSSYDIDDDPITYNFTWSGPNGQSITHNNQVGPVDTLSANTPTTEGLWICSAEATDGIGVSPSSSGTIYVESGCPAEGTGADSTCPSSDCLSILEDGHANFGDDGVYWIDPDGTGAYQAYCDMTTDNGGWTMCYTENADMVHLQTDTTYTGGYGQAGYRTDCREIAFTDVLYINHDNGQKAWFYAQSNTPMTIDNIGYNGNGANAGTLFTPNGVAANTGNYQLMACDQSWMWVGLMMSGYTGCYKQCGNWCGDTSTRYFRTDGDNGGTYNGVAFNQNGHTNVSYKTMSVGIR